MWKLFVLFAFFVQIKCACEDDECFEFYKNRLGSLKDTVHFDDILRRYGISEKGLKSKIDDLNRKSDEAVRKFEFFFEKIDSIRKRISIIDRNGTRSSDKLKEIDRKSDGFDSQAIFEILKNSSSTKPIEIRENAIDTIESKLLKFDGFTKKFEQKRKSLTNLPHLTSNEITLLQSLTQRNGNETCSIDKDKLKKLFLKLITLLDFKTDLIDDATDNLENAKKIHRTSEIIDADAIAQQAALNASEDVLGLAEEVERLKNAIYEKNTRLHRSSFEDALKKLFDKYDTSRYYRLLEELREVSAKIDNSGSIDVDEYQRRIDKAIRYIENCNNG